MNALTARRHAALARRLIDACGGLDEAAQACRVGKSTLSTYQNPNEPATMPADVMADLEAYVGNPIYSQVLCDARPAAAAPDNALSETHEVVQAATNLLPLVMDLLAKKPGAQAAFAAGVARLGLELDDIEAIAAAEPGLRAVS